MSGRGAHSIRRVHMEPPAVLACGFILLIVLPAFVICRRRSSSRLAEYDGSSRGLTTTVSASELGGI